MTPVIRIQHPTGQHRPARLEPLPGHLQTELVETAEGRQVRGRESSVEHVEVFRVEGVRTPIIGRPRPSPSERRAGNYTLNPEEPINASALPIFDVRVFFYHLGQDAVGEFHIQEVGYNPERAASVLPQAVKNSRGMQPMFMPMHRAVADAARQWGPGEILAGVEFTDANRRKWGRDARGKLECLDSPSGI